MEKINWGIIGCGDVTEVKSGPAFSKVKDSSLIAVMRRNAEMAKDYAFRHNVPKWYDNAYELINDPEVNAIYIATPPSSHEEYTLAALHAGKPVYVEKPMSLDAVSASGMNETAAALNVKMVVAHYRRMQPMFKKIFQIIFDGKLGKIILATIDYYKKGLTPEELKIPKTSWRVNSAISGGGLFHDLAPHQLDLMCYLFGNIHEANGVSAKNSDVYDAADVVSGNILFENGIIFSGRWCFNVAEERQRDVCEITGSDGSLRFSIFGEPKIEMLTKEGIENISFEPLEHVQMPMIKAVVEYFLGRDNNPCPGIDGVKVMKLIDQFTCR